MVRLGLVWLLCFTAYQPFRLFNVEFSYFRKKKFLYWKFFISFKYLKYLFMDFSIVVFITLLDIHTHYLMRSIYDSNHSLLSRLRSRNRSQSRRESEVLAGVGVGVGVGFLKVLGVGIGSRSRRESEVLAGVGVGFLKVLGVEIGVGVGGSRRF